MLIAFSCKKRGICPSCAAKRAVLFAEHLASEVLKPVPHRHVTWSIPKIIRPYFKYDRANNGILYSAAWSTVKEMYQALVPNSLPGAAMVLQTSGEALRFNPHLHSLVTDGAFTNDGTFHKLPYFSNEKFTEVFAVKVLSLMHRAGLIDMDRIELINTWEHSGFSVWAGEPIDAKEATKFIARYMDRGPLSLQKLEFADA
ncbi:MAG: transposase, partial [SAR324 cluster bacterium]|nr:transposase [SAR324 cluster bacterium]